MSQDPDKPKPTFRDWLVSTRPLLNSALLCLICIAISVFGIWYAAYHSRCDQDAGRGGAVADAIALFVMFFGRNYSARLHKILVRHKRGAQEEMTRIDFKAIQKMIDDEADIFIMRSLPTDMWVQK